MFRHKYGFRNKKKAKNTISEYMNNAKANALPVALARDLRMSGLVAFPGGLACIPMHVYMRPT
jgi:hypothetical protein